MVRSISPAIMGIGGSKVTWAWLYTVFPLIKPVHIPCSWIFAINWNNTYRAPRRHAWPARGARDTRRAAGAWATRGRGRAGTRWIEGTSCGGWGRRGRHSLKRGRGGGGGEGEGWWLDVRQIYFGELEEGGVSGRFHVGYTRCCEWGEGKRYTVCWAQLFLISYTWSCLSYLPICGKAFLFVGFEFGFEFECEWTYSGPVSRCCDRPNPTSLHTQEERKGTYYVILLCPYVYTILIFLMYI
jgi:hypothetical protein